MDFYHKFKLIGCLFLKICVLKLVSNQNREKNTPIAKRFYYVQ